ncbi:IscU-like NifU protein [Cryptosporidium ryanae]|uniref:IscU-like NifU protein n=1 Tax=Cryptosporidium ryanae TaxID=515981 RepID=UPI00351A13D4|nr:IscU-like NifU protein [Cryptosporidium ryanae]
MLQLRRSFTSKLLPRQWVPICHKALRYSELVHDHFKNPRNVGALPSDDKDVGTAVVGKAACGDVVKLQVSIKDGIIKDAKFKTFGCGSAIASTSYATELIIGKTREEALNVNNKTIARDLNLPPIKLHCSLLAEDAIKHAIRNYDEKQANDAKERLD